MQQSNSFSAWLRKFWLLWVPPVLTALGLVFYQPLLVVEKFVADHILFCPFYEITGLYCPGCGGTRSLTALLHGDVLLAFHENPSTPVLLLVIGLFYIERITNLFGKKLRLFPRNLVFWGVCFGMLVVWDVCRNFVPALMPMLPTN